jgi:hypothetical protein
MRPSRPEDLSFLALHFPGTIPQAAAEALLEHLASDGSLGELAVEVQSTDRHLSFLLGAQPGRLSQLARLVRQLIPGAQLVEADRAPLELETAWRLKIAGRELSGSTERTLAVTRSVLTVLTEAGPGETLVLQVLLGRRLSPRLGDDLPGERYESLWDALMGKPTPVSAEERGRARRKRAGHGFLAQVRLGAVSGRPARARALVAGLLGALRTLEGPGTRFDLGPLPPALISSAATGSWGRYGLPLSTAELVGVIGWPVGDKASELPGMPPAHPRLLPAPEMARTHDRVFARAIAPGQDMPLGIPASDATLHSLFLGPTGSGKSTAILHLALADARAGRALLLVDPKGDLVQDLLSTLPPHREKDVVVIDPSNPERVVGINPLTGSTRNPELVADSLLASFRNTFAGSWGVRSEDGLAAAFLALARTPGATLLWLPRLLSDKTFRDRILAAHPDPYGTASFFEGFDSMGPAAQAQQVAPVLTKLRQILSRSAMRAVLGQANPPFQLSDLFAPDKRPIVLLSLNKGILGETGALLGSVVVGQLWPLILARSAVPPEQRHLVSIYIDEVQDYLALPTDLADAYSQARSLGVAFHAAHQFRNQVPVAMRKAFDANAKSTVLFGLRGDDATEMAKFTGVLEPADLTELPRHHVYLNTMHDGRASGWISAKTLPAPDPIRDPDELRRASAQRYGKPVAEIEEEAMSILLPSRPPRSTRPPQQAGSSGSRTNATTDASTSDAAADPGSTDEPETFGRKRS